MLHEILVQIPSAQALLLRSQFKGKHLASATGFVVDSAIGPVLITCRHVVTGRDQQGNCIWPHGGVPDTLVVQHHGSEKTEQGVSTLVSVTEPLYHDANQQRPRWREHPRLGGNADVVALPLTKLTKCELHRVDTTSSFPRIRVLPSDTVSVVGFPFGESGPAQYALWATGFLASDPANMINGRPIFYIDCRSREGQSGSPVIAFRTSSAVLEREDGKVAHTSFVTPLRRFMGIYSGRINKESDLGIVWSAEVVQDLIASLQ